MTISIIIPVYNTEAYLSACLDSILSQSFSDFEVLLVDDGSKDGSGAICDKYAAEDCRVKVIHKENAGVSSARNLALKNAVGEWICFIDSDDCLYPGGLQELKNGISDQVDLVTAGFIESTIPVERAQFAQRKSYLIDRDNYLASMFNITDQRFEGYIWAKLFRKELIENESISFNPAIDIKEDTLFVVTCLSLSDKKVSVSNVPVYCYLQRPLSVMQALKEAYNPNYLTSFDAVVRMNHLVESSFPTNQKLIYICHNEVMDRVYRILAHMIRYDAVEKRIVSELKRQAFREVGIMHYIDYQFRRNKRRLTRIVNKVSKTNFHV